jgi:AhpD family alkylhydroperoxidase
VHRPRRSAGTAPRLARGEAAAVASHSGRLRRRTAEKNTPSREQESSAASRTAREITMDVRLDFDGSEILQKFVKHLVSAGAAVSRGTLPLTTQNLVLTRASQINGCAVCVDMHTKDAEHAGETSVRLNLVAAWRDAKVFTEAERAALELTEQGTRIADGAGGVTDEAWANAAKHYDTDQLAALVCLIAGINSWNRLNVISRNQGGDYQPGQWG